MSKEITEEKHLSCIHTWNSKYSFSSLCYCYKRLTDWILLSGIYDWWFMINFYWQHDIFKTIILVKHAQNVFSHGVFTVAAASSNTTKHHWVYGLHRQPIHQLWKVLPVQAWPRCCWLTDSGFNIWWGTWDEPKAGLSECVMQGTPKPPLLLPLPVRPCYS